VKFDVKDAVVCGRGADRLIAILNLLIIEPLKSANIGLFSPALR
jgi:hypothetical protein